MNNSSTTMILPSFYMLGYRCGYYLCTLITMIQNNSHHVILDPNDIRRIWEQIKSLPILYKNWWVQLYSNDPTHVYIETTLILMIIYFLIINRTKTSKATKDKNHQQQQALTLEEEEELLLEWKDRIRQPLGVVATSSSSSSSSQAMTTISPDDHHMIIYKNNGRYFHGEMLCMNYNNDQQVDGSAGASTATAPSSGGGAPSSPARSVTTDVVNSNNKPKLDVVLNFATFDFLGMASDDPLSLITTATTAREETLPMTTTTGTTSDNNDSPVNQHLEEEVEEAVVTAVSSSFSVSPSSAVAEADTSSTTVNNESNCKSPMKRAALEALDRYGCGSCGPRGFYGTVDVHLEFEEFMSQYMNTDNAILYSDGASTITSTIAAFCKRGDLVIVDECCYEPIMTGILLSRANVKLFKHNDINDLRYILQQTYESDIKLHRPPNIQRRFIIVEGLYKNTGQICPLDQIIPLKHQYHYRLMIDESYSFGTLGPNGKGCTELYNVKPMYDVEILMLSMENALGSIGGMCVGKDDIIDHQRLSGSGYCFSASSPPFTAAFGIEALRYLNKYNTVLLEKLHANTSYMYEQLNAMLTNDVEDLLMISSDPRSPIVMISLTNNMPETQILNEHNFLRELIRECLCTSHIAMVVTGGASSNQSGSDSLLKKSTETTNSNNNKTTSKKMASGKDKSGISNPSSTNNGTNNYLCNDQSSRIRMTVTVSHTKEDIDLAVTALRDAVDSVMYRLYTNNHNKNVMELHEME